MAASLPGEFLYPVKLAVEKVELALAFSPEAEAVVHLQQAERRVQEANALIDRGQFNDTVFLDALSSMAASADAARESGSAELEQDLETRTMAVTLQLQTALTEASQNGNAAA